LLLSWAGTWRFVGRRGWGCHWICRLSHCGYRCQITTPHYPCLILLCVTPGASRSKKLTMVLAEGASMVSRIMASVGGVYVRWIRMMSKFSGNWLTVVLITPWLNQRIKLNLLTHLEPFIFWNDLPLILPRRLTGWYETFKVCMIMFETMDLASIC
jgi:hypothetical protein